MEAPSGSKTAGSFNGEEEEPSPEEGAQERHPAARALEQAFESAGADAPEHARPAGRLRRKLFLALKQDVINATHVPLTHAELCTASISSPGIWPTCMEAISRSVAAYHKAASATEHDACVSIAANIGGYAHTLSQMVHRPDDTLEDFLRLLHKWIENRSVNVALKNTIDEALNDESCWRGFSDEDRNRAVDIVELCTDAVRANGDLLRRGMNSLRQTPAVRY